MGKFKDNIIGLRSKENRNIIAVYPDKLQGSDEEIEKTVKDWYYKQSCEAEEKLLSSFVDVLSEEEVKSRNI